MPPGMTTTRDIVCLTFEMTKLPFLLPSREPAPQRRALVPPLTPLQLLSDHPPGRSPNGLGG